MQERISIMNQGENGLETNGYAERIRKEGKNRNITPLVLVEYLLGQLSDPVLRRLPCS
jgi:hypothetical protein